MLSIVHAFKKFNPYIFSKEVTVDNNHKGPPPRTDYEEPTSSSTNAATENDTNKPSVVHVWSHHKVPQGQESVSTWHSVKITLYLTDMPNPKITELEQASTLDFLSSPNTSILNCKSTLSVS